MDTVEVLYHRVRDKFPLISSSADRFHQTRWGDSLDVGVEYAWFEALADALNAEIRREVPYAVHEPLFQLIAGAFSQGSEPVQKCIDVSFVENLFWQIPSPKCAPYWKQLPPKLRQLYTEFHHRDP
jgi:hypothetical protein